MIKKNNIQKTRHCEELRRSNLCFLCHQIASLPRNDDDITLSCMNK